MNKYNTVVEERSEFSPRAIIFGIGIGLILLAMLIYLDAVAGMDLNVAPVATIVGIFLLPLFGGPTNRREINIMQACASATAFSCMSLTGNYIAMLLSGQKFDFVGVICVLLLANSIAICLVGIFRNQYVNDKELPFPQAVISKTAIDKIGHLDGKEAKMLFIAAGVGALISLLQNYEVIPLIVDFTKYLPEGMTLGILLLPMMIGMGYVLGSKICLILVITTLLVNLVLSPIGVGQGWFEDPAVDFYTGIQNFNLPMVIGMALISAFIPLIKQRKAFFSALDFRKISVSKNDDDSPSPVMFVLLLVSCAAMVIFCAIYYNINALQMILFLLISIIFSLVAVRVMAESGLSAATALNVFQVIIAYVVTGNITLALLVPFITFNVVLFTQNTMIDLKVASMIKGSPTKLMKAQYMGAGVGTVVGVLFFFFFFKTYGLESDLFQYPWGHMYHALASGLADAGASEVFHLGRFAIGGGLGVIFSVVGLPTGAIALAAYLAPKTIMGVAIGGLIRLVIEKTKGDETAVRLDNAATGLVIGDAVINIVVVVITIISGGAFYG